MFPRLGGWAACDERDLEVPAEHERKARIARLALSYGQLRLLAPDKRENELPSMLVWVVWVWELDPPEGVEPLEWVLVTSLPVESVEQAWQRVGWYRRR